MPDIHQKPSEGTLTRRVWDIADEETRRGGGRLADRKRVIDRVLQEGGNYNTASTQYHYWRKQREAKADQKLDAPQTSKPIFFRIEMKDAGRIALPADIRAAMGVGEGEVLSGMVKDGELRLMTIPTAVRRIQSLVRPLVPEGVSLVDELIADRRAENAKDSKP